MRAVHPRSGGQAGGEEADGMRISELLARACREMRQTAGRYFDDSGPPSYCAVGAVLHYRGITDSRLKGNEGLGELTRWIVNLSGAHHACPYGCRGELSARPRKFPLDAWMIHLNDDHGESFGEIGERIRGMEDAGDVGFWEAGNG